MMRRETGRGQSVQVRYDEGTATMKVQRNHIGPEPCALIRGDQT